MPSRMGSAGLLGREHGVNPNEASGAGARSGRNEDVINFKLRTLVMVGSPLDEPALTPLKAATLAVLDW
jgi:hypothetical protein